ncbi:MAG: response regulator, partial [Nitrospiraceae bacterium]
MSELNGLAVLRQIREGSRTPIIMVAASGSKDRAKQAATVGAQDDCLADCGKTRLVGFDRLLCGCQVDGHKNPLSVVSCVSFQAKERLAAMRGTAHGR